jgi:hypothetical protein
MDAEIVVGVKRAVAMQHADFEFALADGAVVDIGKIGDLADVEFTHAPTVRPRESLDQCRNVQDSNVF